MENNTSTILENNTNKKEKQSCADKEEKEQCLNKRTIIMLLARNDCVKGMKIMENYKKYLTELTNTYKFNRRKVGKHGDLRVQYKSTKAQQLIDKNAHLMIPTIVR